MAKEKLTVYLDPEVAQATRVMAARRKMKDSALVEEALRDWLGLSFLAESRARSADLTEEEAMELAVRVQHEVRQERRGREEQAAS